MLLSVDRESSAACVEEWLLCDGPLDILDSCTRLLYHPKLAGLKGKDDGMIGRLKQIVKNLVTAVKDLDEN